MKFVPSDTSLTDYKKRRSAFLNELIAFNAERERARERVQAMDRRKLT
jgi:hypothetical protein